MAISAYVKQLLNIRNKRSQLGTLIEEAEAISPTEIALANTHILVGAATGKAADVAVSGDATMANTGALTVLNASVIGKVLTGFAGGVGFSAVAATDSILNETIAQVGILNTDLVLVQVASGTGYVVSAISAADSITVVMSADPGGATKLNWFVYR
jgi:ribosome-interacting GTPase 1